MNSNQPAFPVPEQHGQQLDGRGQWEQGWEPALPGLTKREYAAISLSVPDSGDDAIDAMIRKANRMEFAKAAMQGQLASLSTLESAKMLTEAIEERNMNLGYPELLISINAVNYADALLAELEKGDK